MKIIIMKVMKNISNENYDNNIENNGVIMKICVMKMININENDGKWQQVMWNNNNQNNSSNDSNDNID